MMAGLKNNHLPLGNGAMCIRSTVVFAFVIGCFQSFPDVADAQYYRDAMRQPPAVIDYDFEKDKALHRASVLFPPKHPPSPTAFYGNRLSQFRFLGPPERAGIYRLLDWHIQKYELDPRRYRYRW